MGVRIGVIIGMGSRWNKYHPCTTTIGGPNPFQICKFPFRSGNQNYGLCERSAPTPSAKIDVCKQFYEKVKNKCSVNFAIIPFLSKTKLVMNSYFMLFFYFWQYNFSVKLPFCPYNYYLTT